MVFYIFMCSLSLLSRSLKKKKKIKASSFVAQLNIMTVLDFSIFDSGYSKFVLRANKSFLNQISPLVRHLETSAGTFFGQFF